MSSGARGHTPPWPSLYDPFIELLNVAHQDPVQPRAAYLYDANDVFRFTFYWSLIFYLPFFVLCGTFAFLNILFVPAPRRFASLSYLNRNAGSHDAYPLVSTPSIRTPDPLRPTLSRASTAASRAARRTPPRVNPHCTRAAYALLVLLMYIAAGLLGATVGSAVIGYILAALYKAGHFNMSTWMPPIFALVQTLIGILGVYPSIVEIM
ncbi:hypothetical protein M0805_005080 [Coniferiporia weirii]|nr:hypothetical protein M0805_005080 [Coniferiporia weirii]